MNNKGMVSAIIGLISAILSIYTFGILFAPFGIILGSFGLYISLKHHSNDATIISVFAIILSIVGLIISPTFWILLATLILWDDPDVQYLIEQIQLIFTLIPTNN